MWNGIGKLAVMVGVVGIGLFAVFQAQKGMTRIAGLTAPDAANDVAADPSDENGGPDNGTPFNSMKEEPLVVSVGDSDQRKSPDSTRRASASGRNRIDLVRNLESEPSSITPALGSANRKLTLANRESRPTGLSFQDDDEEPFSDTTEVAPAPPQSLPDEAFGAESTSEETTKQTPERAGSSAEDEFTESEAGSNVTAQDAAPESTEDPFKDHQSFANNSILVTTRTFLAPNGEWKLRSGNEKKRRSKRTPIRSTARRTPWQPLPPSTLMPKSPIRHPNSRLPTNRSTNPLWRNRPKNHFRFPQANLGTFRRSFRVLRMTTRSVRGHNRHEIDRNFPQILRKNRRGLGKVARANLCRRSRSQNELHPLT